MPTFSSAPTSLPSISSCGTPKFSRPNRISSSTTDATIWASMSWLTLATVRDMSVSDTSQVSDPAIRTAPKNSPEK